MVAGFRRSQSLASLNPSASPGRRRQCEQPCHLRSTSLPCRSHPALSHLLEQIRSAAPDSSPRSSSGGLDWIDSLLAGIDDILRLPQTQETLRRRPDWAGRLLDGFLRLADAHGSFRCATVALRQHNAEARSAIRRGDPARVASAARCYRRAEKEFAGLASGIKDLARIAPPHAAGLGANKGEAEVVGIVTEAVAATAATSTAVFSGIATGAGEAVAALSKGSWAVWPMRKASKRGGQEAETAAVEEMEEGMEGVDEGSGRVFKSLVNIRVSLLNILTPSL